MPPGVRKEEKPTKAPKGARRTISITPSAASRAWLDPQIGQDKRWNGYTHFVDWAVSYVRETEAKSRKG